MAHIRQRYAEGIGWGEMKQTLFEHINGQIAPARERYEALMQAPEHIEAELQSGAEKARAISAPFLAELRKAVGIAKISG